VGVDTFIRVGSAAIQPGMDVGDLVITTGAVRQEGTSDEYVREDYPAAADGEVVSALVAAAERGSATTITPAWRDDERRLLLPGRAAPASRGLRRPAPTSWSRNYRTRT